MKAWLIGMTAVAVISDAMLIPFYPHYFHSVFGMTDPAHVGWYLGAMCLTVMLAFPFWARVARRVETLRLLVYTQLAAGVLSISCAWAGSLVGFWAISLGMIAFKASYLLIYPMIMSREGKDSHGNTIGLLSVVVHFGGIGGAVLGGAVLQQFDPRQVFLVMALGDFLQVAVCFFLLRSAPMAATPPPPTSVAAPPTTGRALVYKLGLVMLLFYFSAFLIRPFFVRYWQDISRFDSEVAAAWVFAIPGAVAMLALWFNRRFAKRPNKDRRVMTAMIIGMIGLLAQASGQEALVLAGRCLYGWALFEGTVRLDQRLFDISTADAYAVDFSKISVCQNLGVLLASFAAGSLVGGAGLSAPFLVAAPGLIVTLLLFILFFKTATPPIPVTDGHLPSALSRSET